MPQVIKAEDFDFLRELDEWVAAGRALYRFAEEKGCSNSTVTYRMRTYGYDDKRAEGIVSRFTGRTFRADVEAGAVSRGEETAGVPA